MLTKEKLTSDLDTLEIAYNLYEHEPIFTVEEGEHLKKEMPGTHCRNLFLRDKKKKMFLITLANETEVDLKALPEKLECGRLSFGSPDRLWEFLKIKPGSVNPFCIANDTQEQVSIILDQYMMAQEIINVHPMLNNWTIGLSPNDLIKYLESLNKKPVIMGF